MKSALLAFAITLALAGCATTTSPTGRKQMVGGISQAQLDQLGEQAFAQAKAQTPQSGNAQETGYVRCVVDSITRQLPAGYQGRWDVALFQKDEPNAFALPGGNVGVYTGIFKVARNQDQLAAVLAHEIGHVISRHHEERITRQLESQTIVGLAGAVIGSRYGANAGNAVSQYGAAGAQALFLLPNSRAQETEADVVGQQLMARAGYDPRQAVNLWQNMIAASQSRPPEFLSTHPDPQSRLNELSQRAGSLMPVFEQAQASGLRPRCG
ncbi:M48 family metallopeptidase [Cognatilysobacter lacus]|uniref:M48 family metallopeptidase n=1 Tax=Cognatilysobacter lacus TaxID=1643323 RepID=A0A5D8Z8B7_9GAMM|nr:M48 family metallopeptidase [Lysobacter lacus]TZF90890.1 M48 family metallopeptidase [Lysobacter lacus]